MLEDRCANLEEVNQWLSTMPSDALFRGQTHHFSRDGKTNIETSFARHGCVPGLMQKWRHYATDLIRAMSGSRYEDVSVELSQALLQHYGWRSFFVDLTSHFSVAAWFASHSFKSGLVVSLAQDCFEEPIVLFQANQEKQGVGF